jgi:collagenase-like PrtC family protease
MTPIELLAPARDLACGRAAIDCGADAVYIGAPRFGAREAAGNSLDDLAALVDYAHAYWAKVYVTLNTLLRDDELPQAVHLAQELHALGADGLIIQDVGLLECELPPIPLIASTQMHNQTPERVAFLEAVGIGRAILARELTLEEIRAIRAATTLELECFIHGSLCVGYSGQCYVSYALGGRSSNRGACAQPCRKAYTLIDGKGQILARDRHFLSLRDLNLTANLGELLDAGVCSFKIEGRLKDESYVRNVVGHYRHVLDGLLAARGLRRSSSGVSHLDFVPDPEKTFNRGYSTYFLHGRARAIAAHDSPKMVGEFVGTVTSVTRRGIILDGRTDLHPGDGICFYERPDHLTGTLVNAAEGQLVVPDKVEGLIKGTRVFRNHDHVFLTHLAKSRTTRMLPVTLTLTATADGVRLVACDADGCRAEVTLPGPIPPAAKPDALRASLQSALAKTGGTIFGPAEVILDLPTVPFLPLSAVNALRRDVLERLLAVRAAARPRHTGGVRRNAVPFPQSTLTFEGNVLNAQAAAFYRRHGVGEIEPAAEFGRSLHGRRVMTTRYCLKHELGLCPKTGGAPVAAPLTLEDPDGPRLELRFDCARCVMEVWQP